MIRTAGAMMAAMLLSAACAPTGTARTPSPIRDRYMIARAELAARGSANLYDAVVSLRPVWLQAAMGATGSASGALPRVYLDGQQLGSVDMLRSMSPSSVEHVRYLTMTEAQNKFGSLVSTPVVEVTTRGRGSSSSS